ncbi:unnamed protein product, partial [Owenia fusiformis]
EPVKPVEEPPTFLKPLEPIEVKDGEDVVLEAIVMGNPQPEVTWFKDNICIDKSPDHVIVYDKYTGITRLTIPQSIPEDSGIYKCVATNPVGKAVCEASLTVKEPPKEPVTMVETKTVSLTQKKPEPIKEAIPEPVKEPVKEAPPARKPEPVKEPSPESIEVEDEAKRILEVLSKAVDQPPKFTEPIQPQVVVDGDEVIMKCVVTGSPMPEVTWYKDDQLIEDSPPDFEITYNKTTGESVCRICDVMPDDEGVYSVKATNPVGVAKVTANLVVR